jgi:transposase
MPWKESSVMEERLRFVARLLDGETMTEMCREFGISRKTGYKIFDRYKAHGLEALSDRSRRPVRYANQLPEQVEGLIVRLKAEKPHWGARKIRELLVRRLENGRPGGANTAEAIGGMICHGCKNPRSPARCLLAKLNPSLLTALRLCNLDTIPEEPRFRALEHA